MKTRISGIGSALTLALAAAWPALAHEVYPVPASYVRHLRAGRALHSAVRTHVRKPWLFGTPPGGSVRAEKTLFQPIAAYLTRVTGHPIVFRPATNWLTYSQDVAQGKYDLVFDGPHFTSWRDHYLGDVPLIRLPGSSGYAVVTRQNERITKLSQLTGRSVCANSPPSLSTLLLLGKFSDVSRQPFLVVVQSWLQGFHGLVTNRCDAAIVPIARLQSLPKAQAAAVRVLYHTKAYPSQALSASPQIPANVQARIREALLSPAGEKVTQPLRRADGAQLFVPASRRQYAGLSHLLANTLYFSGRATPVKE